MIVTESIAGDPATLRFSSRFAVAAGGAVDADCRGDRRTGRKMLLDDLEFLVSSRHEPKKDSIE